MVNYKDLYLEYKLKYINAKNQQQFGGVINMAIVNDFYEFISDSSRLSRWFHKLYPIEVITDNGTIIEYNNLYRSIYEHWLGINVRQFWKKHIDQVFNKPISDIGNQLPDFINQPILIRERYYRDFIIRKMNHLIKFNKPISLLKPVLQNEWTTNPNIVSTNEVIMYDDNDEWTHIEEI